MRAYYFNFNECQDLSLTEIATQKCEPFFSYGPTILNQYIFHYIISGKGYCCCGNSPEIWDNYELEVNAGEGFLLEPNVKHLYHADPQNPWHYIWIIFNGLSVPQYLHACGISKNNIVYNPKDYSAQTATANKEHLFAIYDHPTASKAYILGHLHLFFDALAQNSAVSIKKAPQSNGSNNFYLSEAIRYIQGQYPNIRSLDEVSAFCNISRSHLGRLFRTNLHMSAQDYLIETRLNQARKMLTTTTIPVSEIAWRVGYQNELNLFRAFKNKYGMPPNTYRKQNTF